MRLLIPLVIVSLSFSLTLEEAKELAIRNHVERIKSEIDLKKLEQRIREVRGRVLPSLSFSARFTRWDPNYISAFFPENKYFLTLTLNQTLFDRSLWYALKVARMNRDLQRLVIKEVKTRLSAEVEKVYWAVLLKREILREKRESLRYWEDYFRIVEEKYRAGIVPRYEFLRARAELRQARADLIRAESDYRTALNNLKVLLGIAEDPEPEEAFRRVDIDLSDPYPLLKNNPTLLVLKKTLEVKRGEVEVRKGEYFPKLTFFFNYNFENIIDFEGGRLREDTRHGYNFGVRFDFLIFDGFSRSARVMQGKLETLKVMEEIAFLERKLRSDLDSLLAQLRSVREEIEARRDTLVASEESLRFATERYREGVGTQVELLEARRNYERSKLAYLESVYSYNSLVAEIKALLGMYSFTEDGPGVRPEDLDHEGPSL
jgi:outer membrane protein TolC